MKRYIYLLIIGVSFLLLYNLFPIREALTGPPPMPQPLIVELVRSDEWQNADAQNSANNAQRLAWQKDNAQQQLNQQNADNKRRQQNEDDQEAQCKADAAQIQVNAANLAKFPTLLANAYSQIQPMQTRITANTTFIQDSSGILGAFVKNQVDGAKARAAQFDSTRFGDFPPVPSGVFPKLIYFFNIIGSKAAAAAKSV